MITFGNRAYMGGRKLSRSKLSENRHNQKVIRGPSGPFGRCCITYARRGGN
jgi:hypothetical protein